jgi:ABC-type antimicrobial peptide transport system permease subunit
MRDAVIVSTARTPIGKAYRGAFNDTQAQELIGHAIRHAVERASLEGHDVEDCIVGAALQQGSTGSNIARQGVIRAGLPVSVAGMSLDRQCASGMMAIATAAKQIGMFLVILAIVSAAIVAFIIYTLTMDKIREIAVLKLIGTRNRTIASMIMQQALALGLIGFVVGKITATFAAPAFPKYVLLLPLDTVAGFFAVIVICVLASIVAIRMALKVDPAEAIGG